MRWSWPLVFALACTNGSSDDTDTGTSEDTGTEDTNVEATCDWPSTDTGSGETTLTGTITDFDGNPLEGAEIGLCKQLCRSLCTDANGQFTYASTAEDTYSFHVRPPHDRDDLVELMWPIPLGATGSVTQDVQVPALPTMVALPSTAAELEIADGLFITAAQGDLEILFSPDPTESGAVAIGTPNFPLPAGTFVGGWFLEPYDATSDAGIPVRFENTFGVGTGASVHVWASSYSDFDWLDMGTYTESGGFLVADSGATGIPVFATLVLMDESSTR